MRSPIRVDGLNKFRGWNALAGSAMLQKSASILYSVRRDKFRIAIDV